MMLKTRQKIALARAAQTIVMMLRSAAGLGPAADVVRNGLRWRLDLREGIDFAIYLLGGFEPSTAAACRRLLKPGAVVLDIGANIGAHTLPLARAVGATGKVIAFEPTQFAYAKLCANLALNPELSARVTAAQAMLLDSDGELPASVYASWPLAATPGAHLAHLGQLKATTGARATTLDRAIAELRLTRIDLIKLDVDGFEGCVLRGARDTLARFRPRLIMEIAPHVLAERGESVESLLGLLAPHHYSLQNLANGRHVPQAELSRLIPDGASLNVLAAAKP